ncbi:MAG: hypothetical protein CMO80_04905 [Verrucomicrobiales bacterium]|nr:hypothetical protein [Verrucomicrobiales bacterium]
MLVVASEGRGRSGDSVCVRRSVRSQRRIVRHIDPEAWRQKTCWCGLFRGRQQSRLQPVEHPFAASNQISRLPNDRRDDRSDHLQEKSKNDHINQQNRAHARNVKAFEPRQQRGSSKQAAIPAIATGKRIGER